MPNTIQFRHCPICGTAYQADQIGRPALDCRHCGYTLYENQIATVGAIIRRGRQVLLAQRGIDPNQGTWDLPGGFVDPSETIEDAILREVEEEMGVKAKIIRLLGAFGPTWYEYKGRGQYNTDLFFEVEPLSDHFVPADDVVAFRWVSLDNLPPEEELSFPSIGKVLRFLKEE